MTFVEQFVQETPLALVGLVASLLAGLATALGALPAVFIREPSQRAQSIMLGFAAGVMLAATAFSLIIPGIDAAARFVGEGVPAALVVAAGLLLGGLGVWLLDRSLPHEHFIKGPEGANAGDLRRVWLFIIAITLHNFPEGLAVGVGFAGRDAANGLALTVGIGLQNVPEGLAVAAGLMSERYSRLDAFMVALLTGLVEPVGGVLGASAVSVIAPLLPWGMAIAAGAMLYVISHEIIPETHRKAHEVRATFALMVGFAVMMLLDVTLG